MDDFDALACIDFFLAEASAHDVMHLKSDTNSIRTVFMEARLSDSKCS